MGFSTETQRGMKQNLVSSKSLGTFPTPGANYHDKGWNSERVARPSSGATNSSSSRRHISALTPFYSGRALPSKWDDTERWICSPVMGYGLAKHLQSQPQRLAKSKSGPIVPPGIACYSNYSPSMQVLDAGPVRNFMVNSPFSTGVLMPGGGGFHYNVGGGGHGEQVNVRRSASVPAWSDLVCEASLPSSPDEKTDGVNEADNTVSRVISRRDMATQMSPEAETTSSHSSSPELKPSLPSAVSPVLNSQSDHPAKLEIREVQVDKGAMLISRSKLQRPCRTQKREPDVEDVNATQVWSSIWDISDTASSDFSKTKREEAKITAWENLQKAKAEAAIRRLEMKLEKKRSSSMDKILKKLRVAQMKAEEMRRSSAVSDRQYNQIPKMSHKFNFLQKRSRLRSLGSCFLCCSN